MLVGLVEGVVGVGEHVVDEVLEERVIEIKFQVFSKYLVDPQGGKYFVGELPVLELLVKLIGSSCVGNPAVKSNQAKS